MNCTPEVGQPSNLWGVFMAKYNEQFKLKVAEEAAQDHILD
jgi:hypothetical protein